jgi:hypothetical protein
MSILCPSDTGLPSTPLVLLANYWKLPSRIVRNLSVLFEFLLRSFAGRPETAVNGHKSRHKGPSADLHAAIRLNPEMRLTLCLNV